MKQEWYEFEHGWEPIPKQMLRDAQWVPVKRGSKALRLRECKSNLPYLLWVELMRLVLRDEAAEATDLEDVIWRYCSPYGLVTKAPPKDFGSEWRFDAPQQQ